MITLLEQRRLKNQLGNEQVAIVPLACCSRIGFLFTQAKAPLVGQDQFRYVLHYDAEGSSCLQQIAPAIVLRQAGCEKYAVKDTAANCLQVVFHAHLLPSDASFGSSVITATIRAADQETGAQGMSTPSFVGHMRSLSGELAGHLGFCHEATAAAIQDGIWYDRQKLFEEYHRFDLWSKYWIDRLYIKNREERHAKI